MSEENLQKLREISSSDLNSGKQLYIPFKILQATAIHTKKLNTLVINPVIHSFLYKHVEAEAKLDVPIFLC